jgi:hypothetical protein
MNRKLVIAMYYNMVQHKIEIVVKRLEKEIDSDERFKDFIEDNKMSIINDITNIQDIGKERFYELTNYDLYVLSEPVVIENVYKQIDDICVDFNRMFCHDKFPRRVVRKDDTINIIKVSA